MEECLSSRIVLRRYIDAVTGIWTNVKVLSLYVLRIVSLLTTMRIESGG